MYLLLAAILLLAPLPAPLPQLAPRQTVIGFSAQGRPIAALTFGNGPRKLALVGDTHGAPEANTYRLLLLLADELAAQPQQIPPSLRLVVVPTLNPDGLANGSRLNARGVDLNRNMNSDLDACPENDWRVRVQGAGGFPADTGGPFPDSEPESLALRNLLLDADAAIFYHSNAGLVFPALCDDGPSEALAQTYAAGAGYAYSRFWDRYTISGGAHDWAASLGIASVIPELVTGNQEEFAQNLGGLRAVLETFDAIAPTRPDPIESGVVVPQAIWRFWRMNGGAARFGPPLAPAQTDGQLVRQQFANAIIERHDDRRDAAYFVELAPLGRAAAERAGLPPPAAPAPGARFFPETQHNLGGGFLGLWERGGGLGSYGYPLTEEIARRDGRTIQYFERAIFVYSPQDGTIGLEPLGWYAACDAQLRAARPAQTIR